MELKNLQAKKKKLKTEHEIAEEAEQKLRKDIQKKDDDYEY